MSPLQRLFKSKKGRLALAAAFVLSALTAVPVIQWRTERAEQALVATRSAFQAAMHRDAIADYRAIVTEGQKLSGRASTDPTVRGMVRYAATILAVEHQDQAMLAACREQAAGRFKGSEPPKDASEGGYDTAADILWLYGDGDLALGLERAERALHGPDAWVMAKLEALRLMVAAKEGTPKITVAAEGLAECVRDEVRALVYLGLWALSQSNTALADQYFTRALRGNPDHPQALLGRSWVLLFRAHPSPEDIWQAQKQAQKILALPAKELTPPVQATALLVRAQALELEGDIPGAHRDRALALQLDPLNLLHDLAKEGAARP